MQVAIFSDVHGNLTALEAVLADIKQHSPDITICAGDLCADGARPAACVQRLRAEDIGVIRGNTDERIGNRPVLSLDLKGETEPPKREIENNDDWTWAQLTANERAWLETLPFHQRVSPTTNLHDDLLVVHANPMDIDQHIYPSEERQKALYGEVRQPDDDLALRKMLGELTLAVVAFGHLHIPNVRQWHGITLANISSVSLPLDGDQRAKYGLLTWDDGWTMTHQYVEYDVDKEIALLKQVQPPNWQELVERLQTASE
ncbi:MAG: metallophosphoesterase family protein [Anaerolineaceae bacterium]|nr:metallophosphoesterase family protein [Anaerolineaceae bacterium]